MTIENDVIEIIADTLGIEPNKIARDSNLRDNLRTDSLDEVEILINLEEKYDLTIPEEKAAELKTIRQITDYIEQHS